jgi:hypothetical protein
MSFIKRPRLTVRQKSLSALYVAFALAVCLLIWPISSTPPWYVFPAIPLALFVGGIALLRMFFQND